MVLLPQVGVKAQVARKCWWGGDYRKGSGCETAPWGCETLKGQIQIQAIEDVPLGRSVPRQSVMLQGSPV